MQYINKFRWITLLYLTASFTSAWSDSLITINQEQLAEIGIKYGDFSKRRIQTWLELMKSNKNRTEREKLELVNDFFNQFEFVDDRQHWGKDDYWASPIEMLATRGGDCEDFSIAKYFTLRELGVKERRMHLTYVKSLRLNQAHMVLTYYPSPGDIPLVLDNLIPEIKSANQRPDLLPVYSFNGDGLWLASRRGEGKRVGNASRIGLWRDLIRRMSRQSAK